MLGMLAIGTPLMMAIEKKLNNRELEPDEIMTITDKLDNLLPIPQEVIDENNIKGIIIGNPLNMDGSSGRSAQSVRDTSQKIEENINIPICLWDERLSTVGAFNLSSQLDINVSKREKKIDENAAAFILQGAIDFLNN